MKLHESMFTGCFYGEPETIQCFELSVCQGRRDTIWVRPFILNYLRYTQLVKSVISLLPQKVRRTAEKMDT